MGTYVKGMTKEALRLTFIANGILHRSSDLIEVKEPHGRLIDEDTIDYRNDKMVASHASEDFVDGVIYANECVRDAPTVIDAEGKR